MSKEQKTIEVKIASLEAFLNPVKSVKIRAESLISDHYRGSYLLDSQSVFQIDLDESQVLYKQAF